MSSDEKALFNILLLGSLNYNTISYYINAFLSFYFIFSNPIYFSTSNNSIIVSCISYSSLISSYSNSLISSYSYINYFFYF